MNRSTGGKPGVSLHGGPNGFDNVDWEVIHPSQATLFNDEEKVTIATIPSSAIFGYTSSDGDQGFPGTLRTEVLVGLLNPEQLNTAVPGSDLPLGSILFVYRAKLLDENKVTPINLTQVISFSFQRQTIVVKFRAQHWGFNLEASLKDDESSFTVKGHKLDVKVRKPGYSFLPFF